MANIVTDNTKNSSLIFFMFGRMLLGSLHNLEQTLLFSSWNLGSKNGKS